MSKRLFDESTILIKTTEKKQSGDEEISVGRKDCDLTALLKITTPIASSAI